jgi:hypothetical protein
MNLPLYEIGIFLAGAVATAMVQLILKDVYPVLKEQLWKLTAFLSQYTPRRILERRKERKRRKQKQQELIKTLRRETD